MNENPENLVGKKFKKLLVIKHLGLRTTKIWTDKRTGKIRVWKVRFYLCRCECGKENEQRLGNIKTYASCKYCGRIQPNCKSRNPLSRNWNSMVFTYYKKTNGVFKRRDKSKTHVCKRWLSSFDNFVKDAGKSPTPKHIFARIDYNKGFTPDNCKWMTPSERNRIRESFKELTMAKLSRHVGLTRERIRQIINNALLKKDNEFIKIIERIDYVNTYKRIVFKPTAIEYFNNKNTKLSVAKHIQIK
jgi:hypothetical protein